jgi:hypothetical protein
VGTQAFVLVLACGAALLALWILMRFVDFGPHSLVWAIIHVIIACVLLRLVPSTLHSASSSSIPAAPYVTVFGLALPLFVYAFLTGGWVARSAMGLLRR